MKTQRLLLLIILLVCQSTFTLLFAQKPIFTTYISDYDQERKAEALIQSIRQFGGSAKDAEILVYVDPRYNYTDKRLDLPGVTIHPIKADLALLGLPYTNKAYAAAQAEQLVEEKTNLLFWFDPETMVLGELKNLMLAKGKQIALRPVFLTNKVAIKTDQKLDLFWDEIYKEAKVDPANNFKVKTVVDLNEIHAYFNCGIVAVNPSLKLFRQWADLQTRMMQNPSYLKQAITDAPHQIFFHQAVFTATVLSSLKKNEIQWISTKCAYPLNLQDQIPEKLKIKKLEEVNSLILEDVWNKNYQWLNKISVEPKLKEQLTKIYNNYYKVTDQIYRFETQSNSYLFTTPTGNVLVDPGGAFFPEAWLHQINADKGLKAILLTHGHSDHLQGIALWKNGDDIPVVAQREYVEFQEYQDRFAELFYRRNSILAGKPYVSDTTIVQKIAIEPTIFFDKKYTFEHGGLTFEMIHVAGETPDQCVIWVPQLKAVCIGDNYFSAFPNMATPRGTRPRWALDYIKAIDTALSFNPEVVLPGHEFPIIGKELIKQKLTKYRDAIQYVHDATVKGMNDGKDVYTLMKEITLPDHLKLPEFFGKVSWAVRGIYLNYVGWFDEQVSTIFETPVSDIYSDLVKLAGGTQNLAKQAREYISTGDFQKAILITDVALKENPSDKEILKIRMEALKAQKAKLRNTFINAWTNSEIGRIEKILK